MTRHVEQFGALGQEDRLEIFRLLVRAGPEGKCVDDIKRRMEMPGSTLSHHLDTLERSGLLTAQRSGRFIYYAVNWPETAKLIRFLTEDCCADMHKCIDKPAPLTAKGGAEKLTGEERNGKRVSHQGTSARELRAGGAASHRGRR